MADIASSDPGGDPGGDINAEQTDAEQTSAEHTSAEQTSAEQTSAEQTSAEQTSVEHNDPGQNDPGQNQPSQNQPSQNQPSQNQPSQNHSSHYDRVEFLRNYLRENYPGSDNPVQDLIADHFPVLQHRESHEFILKQSPVLRSSSAPDSLGQSHLGQFPVLRRRDSQYFNSEESPALRNSPPVPDHPLNEYNEQHYAVSDGFQNPRNNNSNSGSAYSADKSASPGDSFVPVMLPVNPTPGERRRISSARCAFCDRIRTVAVTRFPDGTLTFPPCVCNTDGNIEYDPVMNRFGEIVGIGRGYFNLFTGHAGQVSWLKFRILKTIARHGPAFLDRNALDMLCSQQVENPLVPENEDANLEPVPPLSSLRERNLEPVSPLSSFGERNPEPVSPLSNSGDGPQDGPEHGPDDEPEGEPEDEPEHGPEEEPVMGSTGVFGRCKRRRSAAAPLAGLFCCR